jgi:hypothetical protein
VIRPLRRVHRGAFAGLALLLPALLASAWRVRPRFPRAVLAPELFPGPVERAGADALGDVLVYWSAGPSDGAGLPPDARFVGSLRSGALDEPPPPGARAIGFDLARGEVVALEGAR